MRTVWLWASAGWYGFARWMLPILLRLLGRLEIEHADRVPLEGPVVIVANHVNIIDPILVCAVAPRRLRPMAKRELFETPLVGWLCWLYGAFPVRRYSADLGALRTGRNYLRAGRAVLVHPEGTRSPTGQLQPALPGSAMMALLGGAPIVPAAITGTEAITGPRSIVRALLGRRTSVRVVFGEPFELADGEPSADRAEAATDLMMRRIAALLPEDYRGAYGPGSEGKLVVARQRNGRPPG
jgi:1-acyl-sn-glycerol-3-phosphate acyltransferase